ncbi:hypothetical protein OE88DRAFT_208570 [Heliocybe sulcata]|uniref:Uncharacterized protein n=1 Tax=Heliocybe sulcata TaxID=5364 RepID=A0A5C3N0D0_9AGAM|nr:hypothetical protein OE88DRAFT_208570 [Heliocybe sulcata]
MRRQLARVDFPADVSSVNPSRRGTGLQGDQRRTIEKLAVGRSVETPHVLVDRRQTQLGDYRMEGRLKAAIGGKFFEKRYTALITCASLRREMYRHRCTEFKMDTDRTLAALLHSGQNPPFFREHRQPRIATTMIWFRPCSSQTIDCLRYASNTLGVAKLRYDRVKGRTACDIWTRRRTPILEPFVFVR